MSSAPASSSASGHDPQAELIETVSRLVADLTGNQLGAKQVNMIRSRISKRMLDLKLDSPEAYLQYVKNHQQTEAPVLVSLLTTHHTAFFREFSHFEFLEKEALPRLIPALRAEGRKTIRIWSAACSRGQEVYSLAMFLPTVLKRLAPDFTFEILGTDVDQESVKVARNGVYPWSEVKQIPALYLTGNWARGTGEISEFAKVKDILKGHCRFEPGNLLKTSVIAPGTQFDLIFCRNVFIYFTPAQIEEISANLLKRLTPEGLFFIGLSESLNGLKLPVSIHGPSVYRQSGKGGAPSASAKTAPTPTSAAPEKSAPLRVLCVDDSPVILGLLKKILSTEAGFNVVGTAMNGLEAEAALAKQTVDLVTLDIHMPQETGLEYLKRKFGPGHPPVVMVSSVSRENSDLAFQCLSSGASDYVEKPALADLEARADEIRTKLRCAYQAAGTAASAVIEGTPKRGTVIRSPETKLRIVFAKLGDMEKLRWLIKSWRAPQPPTILIFEGSDALLPALGTELKIQPLAGEVRQNQVYFADFDKSFAQVRDLAAKRRTSITVLGDVSKKAMLQLGGVLAGGEAGKPQLLLEELPTGQALSPTQIRLQARAEDEGPFTSMGYLSEEFLSKDSK